MKIKLFVVAAFLFGVAAHAVMGPGGLLGVIEKVDYSSNIITVRLIRVPKYTRFYLKVQDPQDITKFRPKEYVEFTIKNNKSRIKKTTLEIHKIVWTP